MPSRVFYHKMQLARLRHAAAFYGSVTVRFRTASSICA